MLQIHKPSTNLANFILGIPQGEFLNKSLNHTIHYDQVRHILVDYNTIKLYDNSLPKDTTKNEQLSHTWLNGQSC